MAFGGADFLPSNSPVATKALQLAAIKAVNNASRSSKTLRDFSAQIKSSFETANGHGWHVLVGMDFAVDLRYRKAACVLLVSKKSKVKVLLYRTTPATTVAATNAEEPVSEDNLSKKRGKVTWHSSDMDDDAKAVVVQYTQALVAKLTAQKAAEVHTQLVQLLKQKLTARYGNTWHAIVSNTREISCLPYCDPGTFADFNIDAFRVVVYRHNGVDVDTKMDMTQFAYRAMLAVAAICFVIYGYFAMATTELHTKCGATLEGDPAALPEGCSQTEVALAVAHGQWKSTTFVGLILSTILASSIRMYRRALRQKLKHG